MQKKTSKKPSAHLTPAELVAARFGGVRALGRLLGGSEFKVANWISRGGNIPNHGGDGDGNYSKLLTLARERGVKLKLDELVNGGVP